MITHQMGSPEGSVCSWPDADARPQMMALTIARKYLRSLPENGRVVRFLAQNFKELLTEFQRIVGSNALEG